MRTTQIKDRQGISRPWLYHFIAVNLAVVTVTCGLACSWAAGPAKKDKEKGGKSKATEKVARKTDDTAASGAKDLPKAIADSHPLKPFIVQSEASLKSVLAAKDYSTTLFKKEMVGTKLVSQRSFVKIRHEPFSVYMKFEDPHAGREVIYVDGLNKGKLLVHETGFSALAGTISLLPTSKQALAENRYPITQAGMAKMLEVVVDLWKADAKYQEVQVTETPNMKVGEQTCTLLETIHPKQRDYFKFHKTRLFIEAATKFPIRLEQYTWPEQEGGEAVLVEEYLYTDVKPNLGLADIDFDKNNPAYNY